jgi:DNA topoisomerase-3
MAKFKRLFIAEKGSAGKALAEYLAKSTGAKLNGTNAYAQVGEDIVTWMSGHLLEQVDAHEYDPKYKKWRLDDLPIIPDPFVLVPKRDPKSRAREKIDVIGKLLRDCESVVGFGDPDSEGQLLQDQLLQHLGNRKPVMRLWSSSLDDTKLAEALANMKPNSEYIGWFEAALARSQSDWLYGINMTRACAVHAQTAGADFQITVGRVQTPTLSLVVDRELAIRNFNAVDYSIPYIGLVADPRFRATWVTVKDANGVYEDPRVDLEGRLVNKADSDAIVAGAKAAGKATVIVAETMAGTESAPLPFALSSLQAHCSRLFGLSAKNTLEVAQSLYLKKLTSYPRVDCDYLPESQHSEATRILTSISKAQVPTTFGAALRGAKPGLKSRAWNDSKVTAHHAIIPAHLDNPAEISRLSDIELKVYFEIAKRYVLQFWPSAKFMATEVVLACGPANAEEMYSVKGRRYTDEGWRKAFTVDAEEDEANGTSGGGSAMLPALTKGQVLQLFEAGAESKRTTAPKRFTDGTLITAMKQIHQYVKNPEYKKRLKEGVGIGTEATRASIIDGLIQRGFMTVKGKELTPSDGAMQLVGSLPDIMKSPDMTAMWQQLNDDVMSRASNHAQFIAKLVPWLTNLVKSSSKFFTPAQFPNAKKRAGAAAVETSHTCFGSVGKAGCGSSLRLIPGQYGPFFGCSNDACKKTFRHVEGKPVEKAERPPEVPGNPKYACEKCRKGFLRSVARKDGSGSFWGCSNWTGGCKAIYNDHEGEPDLEGKSRGGGGGSGGGPKTRSTAPRGRPSSYRSPTPTPT